MAGFFQWTPWVTLAAGVLAMLFSGTMFTFGAIHSSLKDSFGFTEVQVQLIGVAGDVGLWTKIFPGLVFDRWGARVTMIVGALISLLGFALTHVFLSYGYSATLVALAWFIAGEGSGFTYTSALFASTKNFEARHRSVVTSFLACSFGLSSSVLVSTMKGCLGGEVDSSGACIDGFLDGDTMEYIKFLCISVPVVTFLAGLGSFVRKDQARVDGIRFRFSYVFVLLVCLMVFIFSQSLILQLANAYSMKTWGNYVIFGLMSLFMLLPCGARLTASETSSTTPTSGPAQFEMGSPFRKWQFWALVFAFGITVGADLMTLNVMSSLAISQRLPTGSGGTLVIVQMASDTLARLSSGFLSAGGIAKPSSMFLIAPFLTVVGQMLLGFQAFENSSVVYAAAVMLGISDGLMWTMGPLLTGQMFGLARVGTNFGVVVTSAAIFQCLLSLVLEPIVYHAHQEAGHAHCIGSGCFSATHDTAAGLAAIAFGLAAMLRFCGAKKGNSEGTVEKDVEDVPAKKDVEVAATTNRGQRTASI